MTASKKIKIGVFSKPLDNWISGSGHHLDELMKTVLDQNESMGEPFDFTFIHYALSDNPIYRRVKEIIIPRFPLTAALQLRKEYFDIIHYAPLTVFSPVAFLGGLKTATVHGIEEELFPDGYSALQRIHARWVLPFYMRLMDGIVTVSNTGKDYFCEHYGIHKEAVCVIANGYSPAYRKLEGLRRQKVVLHISRYSKRKNPVAIMGGFASFTRKMGDEGKSWKLICAGKGWDSDEALALARAYKIEDQYVAPGFVSEEESVRLLNTSSMFVFPSFAEGFGMPNVEAMACGCPVITSGVFAIPEIVSDAAMVLNRMDDSEELGEKLYTLAVNDGLRESYSKKGIERAEGFNWKDSGKAILEFWMRLYGQARINTTN